MKTRDYQGYTFPAHFSDKLCAERLKGYFEKRGEWPDLRGEIVDYHFPPEDSYDPPYIILEYADGRRIRIDGGGDYCASSSVSISELERSPRE